MLDSILRLFERRTIDEKEVVEIGRKKHRLGQKLLWILDSNRIMREKKGIPLEKKWGSQNLILAAPSSHTHEGDGPC